MQYKLIYWFLLFIFGIVKAMLLLTGNVGYEQCVCKYIMVHLV